MEFLQQLRVNNAERQKLWDPDNVLDLSFKALEFSGEAGELASKVKKLVRQELGVVGSRINMAEIEEEVADVLITLDLLCSKLNIDIEKVTKDKFNTVSRKNNFEVVFDDKHSIMLDSSAARLPSRQYVESKLVPFSVMVGCKQYTLYRSKNLPLSDRCIWEKLEHCYGLIPPVGPLEQWLNPVDIDERDITIFSNPAISYHEPFMNGLDDSLYIVKITADKQDAPTFLFLAPNAETIKQYLLTMANITEFSWDKVNRQYLCVN